MYFSRYIRCHRVFIYFNSALKVFPYFVNHSPFLFTLVSAYSFWLFIMLWIVTKLKLLDDHSGYYKHSLTCRLEYLFATWDTIPWTLGRHENLSPKLWRHTVVLFFLRNLVNVLWSWFLFFFHHPGHKLLITYVCWCWVHWPQLYLGRTMVKSLSIYSY